MIMSNTIAATLCDQIHAKLKESDPDGLDRIEFGKTCFLRNKKLKIAKHFEIQPDFLIYISELNNYGLVWVVSEKNGKNLDERLKEYLSQAVYVRHLLTDRNKNNDSKLICPPPPVHVVVVLPRESLSGIAEFLRSLVNESEFFHTIDLHLLPWKKSETEKLFTEYDLEKAFCWLLSATRRWYRRLLEERKSSSVASAPSSSPSDDRFFLRLEIKNYRAMCGRILELSDKPELHLLHGPNGSGKTSLAEVIELCLTGRLERLHSEKGRYLDVLRHSQGNEPIIKIMGKNKSTDFTVTNNGIVEPLWKGSIAASFLLNQEVMHKLSMSGAEQRAKLFLEAFFPQEKTLLDEHRNHLRYMKETLSTLPASLRGEFPLDATNLEKLVQQHILKSFPRFGENIIDNPALCLPLPADTIEILAKIDRAMQKPLAELNGNKSLPREEVQAHCKNLDDALQSLRNDNDNKIDGLNNAKTLLTRYDSKLLGGLGKEDSRIYAQRLNEWLEYSILSRWGEQRLKMAQGLAKAQRWQPVSDDLLIAKEIFSLDGAKTDQLAQTVAIWQTKRDQIRKSLVETVEQPETQGKTDTIIQEKQPILPPTGKEINILNRVAEWIFPPHPLPLGEFIRGTIQDDQVHSLEGIGLVGEKNGWAQELLRRIEELINAYQTLNNFPSQKYNLFDVMARLYEDSAELQKAEEKIKESFLSHLITRYRETEKDTGVSLNQALNELLALFTPGRWAYDPLILSLKEELATLQMETENPETKERHDAEFRLNTAELNQYAVALFLLLAPSLDNPLRLLVLDDPIQNMDELSTVALARGIGNIKRIMPDGWNLLMMFHGEDDMQRFTFEVEAAQYRLPWLRPKDENNDESKTGIIKSDNKSMAGNCSGKDHTQEETLWEII
ncbi:MAG: AAA family ATPase [Magnetococcales bacterium]|nr:AAA family ATPase [Magnetococcales bacterium]